MARTTAKPKSVQTVVATKYISEKAEAMAITCPNCGAEYDVTLFTFDRALRCDCGAWVDSASGHTRSEPQDAAPDKEDEKPPDPHQP
jgi:hypothetical protein